MFKLLIVAVLIVFLSACQVDEREPEDTGALPEPPAEQVPSPVDEDDTIEVPLHVPPVDPEVVDNEDTENYD
jgi:hypothetical protein